ncbi:MAG: hypothetical protein Q8R02_23215 [Hyphomonadaceae bacterium]|nr:hypothetical protein [Hyphomonadaceae bacterium]
MSELQKAATAFTRRVANDGLKNIRFCILPGREITAESLAADINRMDDSITASLCRRIEDPDEGLPPQVSLESHLRELEAQRA